MGDPILERKNRELRGQLDKMTADRDFWSATACDYKRDLGQAMRHGPDGLAFKVIEEDKWERIKSFMQLVATRGEEIQELEMTIRARAILLELEEDKVL